MKHLIPNFNKQQTISLIAIIALSLFIWFAGPLLTIFHQHPLQIINKRLYLIGFLFFIWLIYFFTKMDKRSTIIPSTPEALQARQALLGRFEGAIQFLRKTIITKQDKNINLIQLPWYLIVGPQNSGKTTLLANSNINFTLNKQFKDKIASSETCDWWITRDLVLIDVPSMYLKEKNEFLWQSFIDFIKKHNVVTKVQAVVIALPFPELIKRQNIQQKKQLVADIKQKIVHLRDQFGKALSVYMVVTKCDLLPGFIDFFSDSGAEELDQAWGFALPHLNPNENILDLVNIRFNALIKRLNSQLLWRLHHERNPNLRPTIKDFPLQVERVKETVNNFLKALSIPDLNLQGIYLTSALQSTFDENLAQSQVINPTTQQALQLLRPPAIPSKAYFLRQFILQGLVTKSTPAPAASVERAWLRKTTYAVSMGAIVTAAFLLGHDFQQSVLQTYAIQNHLAQYQLSIKESSSGEHLLKALPLLNTLYKSTAKTNNNLSCITNLLSFYSDKSQKTANKVYQQALQTIVLPSIKNALENYLRNNTQNPNQLYSALRAYLMLGDSNHFDEVFITKTLKEILSIPLNEQGNKEFSTHISAAFSNSLMNDAIFLDKELIAEIRNKLLRMPAHELALLILNNNYASHSISLGIQFDNSPIFLKQSIVQIPESFTAAAFTTTFSQHLFQAATETLQGNWVIGKPETLSNEAMVSNLYQQLQSRYVTNYITTWEGLLNNLKMATPADLAQTDLMIANLTSDASPLLQLLQTIKQNTDFEPINNSSTKIQELNHLLENAGNTQENALYQIFVTLRQLHTYLQTILNSDNVSFAAFEAAKLRMQNSVNDPITLVHQLADQNPEPIKNWLHMLASQSWFFILQNSSQYIENAWQVNIVTIYHSQIASRQPFDQLSNEEIDLQQFANFVGKQGTFANFYQTYLKPFVIDSDKKWQWRMVESQKLPIANSILEQLQQASKLQNFSKYALFTQGRTNPALHKFQLPEKLIDA